MIDKASIFYWMDRPLRFAKLLVNLFPIDLTNGFVKTTTMNYQSKIINNIRTAKLPFDKLLPVSLKCYEGHEGMKYVKVSEASIATSQKIWTWIALKISDSLGAAKILQVIE